MPKPTIETTERRGRPRRFDDDTERRMLLEAAITVIARRGFADMSLADVLAECGLSTRSFYRHFDTKEELLAALLHREVALVAGGLARAVTRAEDPVTAVEAWIDRFLDTFFNPRRVARSGVFTSPAALSALPFRQEQESIRGLLCQPLVDALAAGHQAGALVSPDPAADARSIYGLITNAHGGRRTRAVVRAQVLRFTWPALGLTQR